MGSSLVVLLYPQISPRRERTLLADAVLVVAIVALAIAGLKVHDAIDSLKAVTAPIAQAGSTVRADFRSAADSVSGVPIVGGQLASGLRRAGADSGGGAIAAAQSANHDIDRVASLLGWLIFLVPTLLLLVRFLPGRLDQIRRLNAARRVLLNRAAPSSRQLVAERAAFSLPYGQLLRHTSQPLIDLERGHLEPLIAAALEDAGLRLR
jgi:hypothetical protein